MQENPVYVLSENGRPLMPTYRFAHVRILLKEGKAKVVKAKPFTIQLLYKTTEYTMPLHGGTDPGRENIGEAVLAESGATVYAAHIETRNKDIVKLNKKRAAHRRASRQGERKRRQRRAIKNGTIAFPLEKERVLPKCEEPIVCKLIKNSEARFANRKRPKGWITPTVTQLVRTHINAVKQICSILPVTDWTLEINRFAFMLLEDGSVRSMDFQNGRLKGYESVNDYIYSIQEGKCAICGKPIECYHHLVPRNKGGSDRPENICGLCKDCHGKVHTTEMSKKLAALGEKKKYTVSALNQAIPYIYDGLVEIFGEEHVHVCYGYETAAYRKCCGFQKTHDVDAVCIAALGSGIEPKPYTPTPYEVRQFRRHNRAIIHSQRERTYKFNGVMVAKNRKPRFEQEGDSLQDFVASLPVDVRDYVVSKLTVEPSKRHYNTEGRFLPGSIFYYKGKCYVLSGQISRGAAYRAVGQGNRNFPAKQCKVIPMGGLVYI